MAKEKPGGSERNAAVLGRLRAMRWPGESYSDVILRLAAESDLKRGICNAAAIFSRFYNLPALGFWYCPAILSFWKTPAC